MENIEKIKVLIVEDEPTVRVGLEENLKFEGYNVFAAENGHQGVLLFKQEKPSLVILDLMMPGLDGFEVCRQIRAVCIRTPIIMLTAKGSEVDKVVGLEIGADDYLTKPFGMRELFARMKALLRRAQASAQADASEKIVIERLEIGSIVIDFKAYRAKKGEEEILLSAKEFELLKFLSSRPDIPVSRDELLDQVWGYNSYPTTRTVDNFIARLRNKLEDTPDNPRYLLTVHGVGYKFVQ